MKKLFAVLFFGVLLIQSIAWGEPTVMGTHTLADNTITETCSIVATIAVGDSHIVGLNQNGTVISIGYNNYGQLNVTSWRNIKAIAAGGV
jgi:alpha-tubulin suppressor-like RCC1 family protein